MKDKDRESPQPRSDIMRSDRTTFLAFNYRSRSRSGTVSSSSRRSSGSRRGEERWREGEQLEEKLERMMIKPRLSPLIEVIEPTPPLCRNAPVFGMTGETICLLE